MSFSLLGNFHDNPNKLMWSHQHFPSYRLISQPGSWCWCWCQVRHQHHQMMPPPPAPCTMVHQPSGPFRTTNHGGWHPVGCMKALRRLDAPSTHPPCSALQSAVVQPRKVQNTAWQCSADQWGVRSGGPLLYSAVGGPPRSSFPTHTHQPTLSSTSLAWTRYVLQATTAIILISSEL